MTYDLTADAFNQQYQATVRSFLSYSETHSFHSHVEQTIRRQIDQTKSLDHRGVAANQLSLYRNALRSLRSEIDLDLVREYIIIDWFLVYGIDHLMPIIVRSYKRKIA